MNEFLAIEIVIRKSSSLTNTIRGFREQLKPYMIFETDNKMILNISPDSEWFKDGTMNSLLREFDRSIYVALAYFSSNGESVTDFSGNPVSVYSAIINERFMKKYVKRTMLVTKVLDNQKEIFEISGYALDLRSANPVVKVLNIYSNGCELGIGSSHFLRLIVDSKGNLNN